MCIFDPLKKLFIISSLLVFLCANTELHELMKLPVFVHHYFEHQKSCPQSTLADFIYDHYNSESDHSAKKDHHHHRLPLKANDCGTFHASKVMGSLDGFYFRQNYGTNADLPIFCNQEDISSSFFNKVWQPPQFT